MQTWCFKNKLGNTLATIQHIALLSFENWDCGARLPFKPLLERFEDVMVVPCQHRLLSNVSTCTKNHSVMCREFNKCITHWYVHMSKACKEFHGDCTSGSMVVVIVNCSNMMFQEWTCNILATILHIAPWYFADGGWWPGLQFKPWLDVFGHGIGLSTSWWTSCPDMQKALQMVPHGNWSALCPCMDRLKKIVPYSNVPHCWSTQSWAPMPL